jgi:hypothetical protein
MKTLFLTRGRRGQAMVFLIMVVVILAFIALWNFDLHKIIYIKSLSLNASDAAGIAGARWQGISLNLLGCRRKWLLSRSQPRRRLRRCQ